MERLAWRRREPEAYGRLRARDPARVEAIAADVRSYARVLRRLGVRDPWALELAPLRPGDDLTLDIKVEEARVSKSRPDTGIVTFKGVVKNASGVTLAEMVSPIIVRRRADAAAE